MLEVRSQRNLTGLGCRISGNPRIGHLETSLLSFLIKPKALLAQQLPVIITESGNPACGSETVKAILLDYYLEDTDRHSCNK